jgi:hypothetical protein
VPIIGETVDIQRARCDPVSALQGLLGDKTSLLRIRSVHKHDPAPSKQ